MFALGLVLVVIVVLVDERVEVSLSARLMLGF